MRDGLGAAGLASFPTGSPAFAGGLAQGLPDVACSRAITPARKQVGLSSLTGLRVRLESLTDIRETVFTSYLLDRDTSMFHAVSAIASSGRFRALARQSGRGVVLLWIAALTSWCRLVAAQTPGQTTQAPKQGAAATKDASTSRAPGLRGRIPVGSGNRADHGPGLRIAGAGQLAARAQVRARLVPTAAVLCHGRSRAGSPRRRYGSTPRRSASRPARLTRARRLRDSGRRSSQPRYPRHWHGRGQRLWPGRPRQDRSQGTEHDPPRS